MISATSSRRSGQSDAYTFKVCWHPHDSRCFGPFSRLPLQRWIEMRKCGRDLCIVSPGSSSPFLATAFTQMRLYQFLMLMCSPRLGRKTKASGGSPEQTLLRGTTRKRGIATRLRSQVFEDPRTGLPLSSSFQVRRTLARRFSKSISETLSAVASPIRGPTYARNRTRVLDMTGSILSASSARFSTFA